jgi:hydroxypyruvate reductase
VASSPTPARRELLTRAFEAAVAAADPVRVLDGTWPEPPAGRLIVLGLGKAAAAMAAAAEARYRPLGVRPRGAVVVPYGHGVDLRDIEVLEAGHPVPDAAGAEAARALLRWARAAGEDDLVLVLVSGGGSALTTLPDGIDADEAAELNRALLASGADIHEINRVRRRLDRVKGGRLAAAAHPARVVARVVSDVVGDDPLDVASGPTVGDPGDAAAALAVLDRYGVDAPAARRVLEAQRDGRRDGPPRPDDPRLAGCETRVVASAGASLAAAARVFEEAGVPARLLDDAVTGDARRAAREQAEQVRSILDRGQLRDGGRCRPPVVLLSGGETTVRVRGSGRGGRNSTFALALALALPDGAPVHALVADSDGVDGVGGHAGAFLDPDLFARLPRAEAEALDADDDSYRAFERAGALFRTGPTRTNVNDLRFVWIDPAPGDASGAAAGVAVDGGA